MIPKRAIEKAIEGGWGYIPHAKWHSALGHDDIQCMYLIALDPAFWQALGKALGWDELEPTDPLGIPQWRNEASVFYDLILTGGDTDAFWQEILDNK